MRASILGKKESSICVFKWRSRNGMHNLCEPVLHIFIRVYMSACIRNLNAYVHALFRLKSTTCRDLSRMFSLIIDFDGF